MKVIRLKHLLKGNFGGVWGDDLDCNENSYTYILRSTEQNENGNWVINWESVARRNLLRVTNFHTLKKNDIVITKSSGSAGHIGKATLVDENIEKLHCSFSNFMQCLQLDAGKCNPRFYWYYLNSRHCKEQYKISCTTSTGLLNLNSDTFNNLNVPFFSVEYQNQCVAFLDKTISKIEDAIEKHKIQLDFLSSYRQSLITRAVTKGLDPNVEMKASGVQWIGNMPSHWRICRVKNLFSVVCGATPSPNPQYWNGNINWIGPSDMDEIGDVSSGKRSITREGYESCGTTLVPQGSLVLSTRAPVGKVNIAKGELCTNQGCKSLVPLGSKNYTKYYYFVLQAAKDQLIQDSSGTTFLELSTSALSDELLPLPSLDEQKRIVSFLEKIDEMVLELKVKLSDSIRLLNEYRSSLISAAVTGQLAIDEEASA